jgi:putative phosphoribosyl transferase
VSAHKGAVQQGEVTVQVPEGVLGATLVVPARPEGLVIFAHGSGSSRFSARNRFVAEELKKASFGTLLMDLLTQAEERRDEFTGEFRFDIRLLAKRLQAATAWASRQFADAPLPVGYFGASTGAAAALVAAAAAGDAISAIVSRGGRPDPAGEALQRVTAPTLLIVGGNDQPVIGMNQQAQARMRCLSELVIVPGATHLFEEKGTLERVAELAAEWFRKYLSRAEKVVSQ